MFSDHSYSIDSDKTPKKLQAHPHSTMEKQCQREPLIRINPLSQVFTERKARGPQSQKKGYLSKCH